MSKEIPVILIVNIYNRKINYDKSTVNFKVKHTRGIPDWYIVKLTAE